MKKILIVMICLSLMFCLCACGDKITHGEVYEKEYREAYTTVMVRPLVIPTGKSVITTMVPYTVHYPERWVIFIKDFNGEEWVTEDFYVSKEVFDTIQIGDMFEYNKDRGDIEDEPYTKERQQESEGTENG
jgi:hypothetical protein